MKYEYTFSVITVCYNASTCIEKTVHSVMKQDCKDFEYIIIDGLSKDDTVQRVMAYEPYFDGRIKIISELDKGLYDAMNKGIYLAKGEYLIFINADDELCLDILTKIKAMIYNRKNRPEIIYGDAINVYYDGNKTFTRIRNAYPQITCNTLKKGMGVVHQSIFTRKTVFDQIGGFNLQYSIGADWDFLIRSVKANISMLYVNIPVSIFPTNGISAGVHNIQRHKIRKNNKLYKFIDLNLFKDVLNLAVMIQLVIGKENFKKLRYVTNRIKKEN